MEYPESILKEYPYYDFHEAIEECGFDFDQFVENGFKEFLNYVYLGDFLKLRESFLDQDLNNFYFIAHKFKSSFG
jgi:hypothetical protein